MRARRLFLLIAVALVAGSIGAANATILHEDIAYWYQAAASPDILTIFNPDQVWLTDHAGQLKIKIQQTVYDEEQTKEIVAREGIPVPNQGFLYAYTVTNLNWTQGLTGFKVDWSVTPLWVAMSHRVMPAGWSIPNPSVPEWHYSPPTEQGIGPGDSVGGFWALAATGVEDVDEGGLPRTPAYVRSVIDGETYTYLAGKTSGPLPDPASIVTLCAGLISLGITRAFKRK